MITSKKNLFAFLSIITLLLTFEVLIKFYFYSSGNDIKDFKIAEILGRHFN